MVERNYSFFSRLKIGLFSPEQSKPKPTKKVSQQNILQELINEKKQLTHTANQLVKRMMIQTGSHQAVAENIHQEIISYNEKLQNASKDFPNKAQLILHLRIDDNWQQQPLFTSSNQLQEYLDQALNEKFVDEQRLQQNK